MREFLFCKRQICRRGNMSGAEINSKKKNKVFKKYGEVFSMTASVHFSATRWQYAPTPPSQVKAPILCWWREERSNSSSQVFPQLPHKSQQKVSLLNKFQLSQQLPQPSQNPPVPPLRAPPSPVSVSPGNTNTMRRHPRSCLPLLPRLRRHAVRGPVTFTVAQIRGWH